MSDNSIRFLFIGAHPDDETQVGGTLALLAERGQAAASYLATPGKGGKPNPGEEDLSDDVVAGIRAREAEIFARRLGASVQVASIARTFLENREEDLLALISFIRKFRPNIVALQNAGDYHFEHRRTRELALVALENAARSAVLELGPKLSDFIILETDGLNALANPSIFIDTSTVAKKKAEAIAAAYGARLGTLSRLDEGMAMMRGGRIGVADAEAFAVINPPWYRLTAGAARALAAFTELGTSP